MGCINLGVKMWGSDNITDGVRLSGEKCWWKLWGRQQQTGRVKWKSLLLKMWSGPAEVLNEPRWRVQSLYFKDLNGDLVHLMEPGFNCWAFFTLWFPCFEDVYCAVSQRAQPERNGGKIKPPVNTWTMCLLENELDVSCPRINRSAPIESSWYQTVTGYCQRIKTNRGDDSATSIIQ